MNDIHFDVSNVRGFAENLHYKLENEFLTEIARIKALLLGDGSGDDLQGSLYALFGGTKPMGNVDADYYGRDIAEAQMENVAAFIEWLDNVERSIRAVINAGLYMAEEMDKADGATAANIDLFFEKTTFELMDYLDPANDYPGR
ncbi:hypothetical protein FB566_1857 [Stackebrandtia endophytica]|uniref:Uncharacterized protein n=1 Tax=Stackebrandtia endophytica TaxID=1496996 RepID=A0A543AUT0_9ACTN|nr:hypothetical protein [Stackebrandtia endophytica]TQL76330.1 hypothetical protein FB566_1857 [Stackebrandtia endophytica]